MYSSRKNAFSIHVYLTQNGTASGELYWDDGVSKGKTNWMEFIQMILLVVVQHNFLLTE